jgi:hypothetical protein
MGKINTVFIVCFFFILSLNAQHHIGVGGGYSQSIFYCGLPKSQYYTKFQPEDAFLRQATYKYDVPIKKENMRIGGQLEWKRQAAYFYYEDRRNGDTVPSGIHYKIDVLHLCVFPEIVVGDPIRFIFSGGPTLDYVIYTRAKGIRIIDKKREKIEEANNGDIKGFAVGAKLNLGLEFPVYKNFYITLQNAYAFGLSTRYGRLKTQMKYFNCMDINLTANICYQINYH